MKLAARQLAAPSYSHSEVKLKVVKVELLMFVRLNATLKGRPCEMA